MRAKTGDRSALLSHDGASIVSAVLASLFPASCYVSLRSAGAQPGSSRRFCTEHDEDPLRRCQSAPRVSSRSSLRPLGWLLKGGLLLHFGGLVPGWCTSGACTESVTAGADACANCPDETALRWYFGLFFFQVPDFLTRI